MAVKITALPATASADFTDLLEKVDDPGGVPISQKLTLTQLFTLFQQVHQGNGAPAAPPASNTIPHLYTDLVTGDVYTWNVVTQAWV